LLLKNPKFHPITKIKIKINPHVSKKILRISHPLIKNPLPKKIHLRINLSTEVRLQARDIGVVHFVLGTEAIDLANRVGPQNHPK
jgi:hypothetical protein